METNGVRPEIGQWYAHKDKGELFQVVGRDEDSRTIEIQYVDGDLDEIEADTWTALPLELAEPPEDMTAPMDDIEKDDLGYSETDMSEANWQEPLQTLKPSEEGWEDIEPEDEGGARGEKPAERYTAEVPEAEQRGS